MEDEMILEIATLIHHKWAINQSNLQLVRKETNDGSKDWELFHEDRLALAELSEKKWFDIKTAYQAENSDVIRKAFQ